MTVHPPGVETLPTRVYTLMANSPGAVTAALALLMVALTASVTLVAGVAVVVAATGRCSGVNLAVSRRRAYAAGSTLPRCR